MGHKIVLDKRQKNQKQFQYIWDCGDQNEGDYWTKHHPTHYHVTMIQKYIKDKLNILITKLTPISTF